MLCLAASACYLSLLNFADEIKELLIAFLLADYYLFNILLFSYCIIKALVSYQSLIAYDSLRCLLLIHVCG